LNKSEKQFFTNVHVVNIPLDQSINFCLFTEQADKAYSSKNCMWWTIIFFYFRTIYFNILVMPEYVLYKTLLVWKWTGTRTGGGGGPTYKGNTSVRVVSSGAQSFIRSFIY